MNVTIDGIKYKLNIYQIKKLGLMTPVKQKITKPSQIPNGCVFQYMDLYDNDFFPMLYLMIDNTSKGPGQMHRIFAAAYNVPCENCVGFFEDDGHTLFRYYDPGTKRWVEEV